MRGHLLVGLGKCSRAASGPHSSSHPIQPSCLPFRGTKEAKTWRMRWNWTKLLSRETRGPLCCAGGNMALSAGKEPPALLGQQSSGTQARARGGLGGSQPLGGVLPKSSPSTACLQKRKPRQRPALTWITPHQWQGWGPRGRGLLREPGSHEEQRPPRGMGFEREKAEEGGRRLGRTHREPGYTPSACMIHPH